MLHSLGRSLDLALSQGSLGAIFLSFLLGMFISFTPCVYPVLPLVVSYIGSISRGRSINGFVYSLFYVIGMAVVYCAIGIVTVAVGINLRALWNNGWVLLVLANFFLVIALWQLGVIRFRTIQVASSAAPRKWWGPFVVGAASGLVVGPCTVPGLAAMLVLIGKSLPHDGGALNSGQFVFGALAMFAYSLGLGTLMIIAGTFSGFLANLPKSGRWLIVVEKLFAILMILLAEFFLIYLGQNARFPFLPSLMVTGNESSPRPASGQSNDEPKSVKQAEPSDWTLPTLDGDYVTLSQYAGKKGVVLIFFATWCPACIEEIPQNLTFAKTYANKGIEVLGINYMQSARVVRTIVQEKSITYKVLLDENGRIGAKYGADDVGIPLIIGIDAEGEIRYSGTLLPPDWDAFVRLLEPKQ